MSHMDKTTRQIIKDSLDGGERDLGVLAARLGRDRTTICREIRKRRIFPAGRASSDSECPLLFSPPYVCNGCAKRQHCRMGKCWYDAEAAQAQYRKDLVESRKGVDMPSRELARMNTLLYEGVARGQSVHHVVATHRDDFTVCEKTIYNLINANILAVKRHHLPEAACRKSRPRKSKPRQHKVERNCRAGRTYDDYRAFLAGHPGACVVEMDSVLGGREGSLLLTFNFNCCGLMLAFLRDAKCFVKNLILNGVSDSYLHSKLVKPHRIVMVSDGKALTAFAILTLDKLGICVCGLIYHIVVDNAELAPVMIAARTKNLVNYFRGYRDLAGV